MQSLTWLAYGAVATDALVLGNWVLAPKDAGHFAIKYDAAVPQLALCLSLTLCLHSHLTSSNAEKPQLLLRTDGNIFCNYVGAVGDRVSALSERGNVLRVGNWLMGSPENSPDEFVISKLGTGEVIGHFLKNGAVYLNEKVELCPPGPLSRDVPYYRLLP